MRNLIVFCFFIVIAPAALSQDGSNLSEVRVFEGALVKLISEPSELVDGEVQILDLNKHSDPSCRTCWETFPLSSNYWLKIAGYKSKAKLSDVYEFEKITGTVFLTRANKVKRISYRNASLTDGYYSRNGLSD